MEGLIIMFSIIWLMLLILLFFAMGDENSKKVLVQQSLFLVAAEISISIVLAALIISYNLPKH